MVALWAFAPRRWLAFLALFVFLAFFAFLAFLVFLAGILGETFQKYAKISLKSSLGGSKIDCENVCDKFLVDMPVAVKELAIDSARAMVLQWLTHLQTELVRFAQARG